MIQYDEVYLSLHFTSGLANKGVSRLGWIFSIVLAWLYEDASSTPLDLVPT